MTSNQENNIILKNEDLKNKILQEIKSGTYHGQHEETICCKYKNGAKTEYDKMTKKDCLEVFFGDVVDDSNCN